MIPPGKPQLKVALIGGLASGKSTVAQGLSQRGAAVIDADQIARSLTAAGGAAMPLIARHFGPAYLQQDGSLNRDYMRSRIFCNRFLRKKLENLLRPLIMLELQRHTLRARGPYLVYVIPLFRPAHRRQLQLEQVILVDCERRTQIERAMRRNGLTRFEAAAIVANQSSRQQRQELADQVINNCATTRTRDLAQQIENLHRQLFCMAKQKNPPSAPKGFT